MAEDLELDSVDFEIALTALLATLVTAYPIDTMAVYPVMKLAAIALLAITLVKRVGIRNGFTGDDSPLLVLTYLMDPLTSVSFLYCCYVAVRWLVTATELVLSTDQLATVVSVVTILVVFGLLLASEVVFGDMVREAARIFDAYAAKHRGEAMGYVLRRLTARVRQARTPGPTTIKAELTDPRFYDIDMKDLSSDQRSNVRVSWAVFWLSGTVVVLSYPVLFGAATFLVGTSWMVAALLLMASLAVSAFFELWYSRYGLLQPESRHRFVSPFTSILTYAVVILMVM